ncbi:MAG: bifunctional phosphoglucose/phosphomannose isomerase [Candidatus Bathyarchaeia archaeon]
MEVSLDDLERIRAVDRSGMLETQMSMPEAWVEALRLAERFLERGEVRNLLEEPPSSLVIAGMGGSAIGGEILRDWLLDSSPIPIYVSRGYRLPAFTGERSLVFAVSYSGNTEETLSSFQDALSRGCRIIAVTSGGRLRKLSLQYGVPCLTVPEGMAPRAALPYLLLPLVLTCGRFKVVPHLGRELDGALKVLRELREMVAPENPLRDNPAKLLALDLLHTIPVIYAPREYAAVALRMKTQFNENSKVPSYAAVLPEIFHNEVMGYEAPRELSSSLSVILLRDEREDPKVRAKVEAMKGLLKEKIRVLREVWSRGEEKLAKIFSMLFLGDVASTYLAVLYGVDPTPVESISRIKEVSTTYL